MGAMKCAAHNTRYCEECDVLAGGDARRPVPPPVPPAGANATPREVARFNDEYAAYEKARAGRRKEEAREARETAINAKAWQLFRAHIDRGLLDRLGSEKDDAARKAIATAACNALEAAEIFVKTVEE